MKHERIAKRRHGAARALEAATVPERPFRHGPRYIVHPEISRACAPHLHAIAALLRDETRPVDDEIVHELRAFVTDGGSPFFGRDTPTAVREAARLHDVAVNGASGRSRRGTVARRRRTARLLSVPHAIPAFGLAS